MKRVRLLLSCGLALLIFCSCGVKRTEIQNRSYTDERLADNGKLLASCTYEVPEMVEGSGKEKFNQYYEAWLSKQISWFNEVAGMASADYDLSSGTPDEWDESDKYLDTISTTYYQNKHMVCVIMDGYSYTGGIHGIAFKTSACFDLSSGEEINLLQMTTDYSGFEKAVESYIHKQIVSSKLYASEGENSYFDDFDETISEWESRTVYFDSEGMHVVFGVYDIATFGAGEQNFLISYEMIKPYLNDQAKAYLELN